MDLPTPPSTLSAVLFDLDGVLVDSRDPIARSINHALEQHGVEPRPEPELHAQIGAPLPEVFEDLLRAARRDVALVPSCVRSYRAHYGVSSLVETRRFDGIVDVLQALGKRYRLAVATTKPAEYARPILEAVGLLSFFEVVVGSPLHDHRSESKSVTIRRALGALGLPEEGNGGAGAAMVGDRHFDVVGGRANGLFTIGVTWGVGDEGELREAGAARVVDHPSDLLDLFAS